MWDLHEILHVKIHESIGFLNFACVPYGEFTNIVSQVQLWINDDISMPVPEFDSTTSDADESE